MKTIITGCHGFIGGELYKRLSKHNDVFCIDRKMLYRKEALRKLINRINPQEIYHLASYGNHYFQTEEYKVYKANVLVLVNLLEAIKHLKGLKYMANFSTTHHNLESGSSYGSTKSAGEYLVRSYVSKYNLPIVNIRPYSIYGEREWDFRFIPTISANIKKGKAITVSDVTHDWTYIKDFIDVLLTTKKKEYIGKSVGIGTGKRVSNKYIANLLMAIAGKEVPIVKGGKRTYEIAAYTKSLLNDKNNNEIFLKANKTSTIKALTNIFNSPKFLER